MKESYSLQEAFKELNQLNENQRTENFIEEFIELTVGQKRYGVNSKKELEDFIFGEPELFERNLDVYINAYNEADSSYAETMFHYENSALLDELYKLHNTKNMEDEEIMYDELDNGQSLVIEKYQEIIDKIFEVIDDYISGHDIYDGEACEQFPNVEIKFSSYIFNKGKKLI